MDTNKLMNMYFRKVDTVVYDLVSGGLGVKAPDNQIVTLTDSKSIEVNPFDSFSMPLPAFAVLTPTAQVSQGDILLAGGKASSFVTGVDGGDGILETIDFEGRVSQQRPVAIKFMGREGGVQVVRSFANMFGGAQAASGVQQGINPMMLYMLMGNKSGKSDFKDMLPLLMLSGGLGGGAVGGGIDPSMLMMMSMMGDSNPFA